MPPPMQPARERQKERGGKKRRSPPSSTSSPALTKPLDAFFANYAPRFQYDATVSATLEFSRLCNELGWRKNSLRRKNAHQKFKDALVQQFNVLYGTDVNDLRSWQNLCYIVRVDPIPDDLHACREAVYYSFVNLVDLVDTKTTGKEVELFQSERALSEYTRATGKIFPRENAYASTLLKHLLRRIQHPRDGYDTSRGGYKYKGPGRR